MKLNKEGLIPKRKDCPFLSGCKLRKIMSCDCTKNRNKTLSCAWARFLDRFLDDLKDDTKILLNEQRIREGK